MRGRASAEARVRQVLRAALSREVRILAEFARVLSDQVTALENTDTPSAVVQRTLLGRLAGDLRVIEWSMTSGYPVQAWSLATSVHEVAYTSGYIATDDALAQKWLDWPKPTGVPWSSIELEKGALKRLRGDDKSSPAEARSIRAYTVLSLAKHGNPMLQKRAFVPTTAIEHRLNNDPEFSPQRRLEAQMITYLTTLPVMRCLLILDKEGVLSRSAKNRLMRVSGDWVELGKEFHPPTSPDR